MRRLEAGGLGLIAAAAVCLLGTRLDPVPAGIAWSAGAWLAVLASATAYRSIARSAHRALAASGLALLGVAASARTVDATLRIAFPGGEARRAPADPGRWAGLAALPVPARLPAVAASTGLAMLALAAWRANLVPPAGGVIIATAAASGSLTAGPALPYVLGAGPLGVALLSGAGRRGTRAAGARHASIEKEYVVRTVYKVLAYAIAVEVAVQAMLMVYAIAGEFKWVTHGGVLDKGVIESHAKVFPEVIAIPLHGLNGSMIIPLLALLLLISSFFARIPRGVRWAGLVLLLVVIQISLGFGGEDLPALGGLHGINALLLFTAALYTARRSGRVPAGSTAEPPARVETAV